MNGKFPIRKQLNSPNLNLNGLSVHETHVFRGDVLLNSTLNFGIQPVLEFKLEVYYKVGRFLTGLIAQQKGTIARWYSNKTSLINQVFLERGSRL